MKKLISILLTLVMTLGLCAFASAEGTVYKVGICNYVDDASLNQICDNIIAQLGAIGEEKGVKFEIDLQNCNADASVMSQIISNFIADGVDLMVGVATPVAMTMQAMTEDNGIPVVFAAVSDPVAAGLTGEDSSFITGVSNNIPAAEIVNLISDFQPDYKLIGFLYTSSETNSVSTINAAKAYCDASGIAYEEVSIANLSELQTAVETLISRNVDALYTGNDNSIASAMSTYIDVAYEYGIPVYCGADSMVADGGFATIGVDYVQLGCQVAALVERIAMGEEPEDIPYETLSDYARFVNLQAAGQIGMDISDEILAMYNVLVEADGTSHFGE